MKTFTCPVCAKEMADSMLGIQSHLKKHVREGKITDGQRVEILNERFEKEKKDGQTY